MKESTGLFQEHLQRIVQDSLGITVSRGAAWQLFKDIQEGVVRFTVEHEKVSLAGVGCFEVRKGKVRGKKVDEGWQFNPRFKYYPSSAYQKKVAAFYGYGDEQLRDLGIYHQ